MLTSTEIANARDFHYGECKKVVGPRGGVKVTRECARRNGSTKYWKTRPNEFSIPVKVGMYGYGHINELNVHQWHTAQACTVGA